MGVKTWARENEGKHPDSILGEKATSNMAFRELFKSDIMLVERVFSTARSPFIPDGEIGSEPDYAKAQGDNRYEQPGKDRKAPGKPGNGGSAGFRRSC
jgi:hypothetical protein